MEIKLFGKNLFSFRKNSGDQLIEFATEAMKETKHLPDFKTLGKNSWEPDGFMIQSDVFTTTGTATTITNGATIISTKRGKESKKLTPKKVYSLKMLHDEAFKINMDPKYVDKQIEDFREKLSLMKDPRYNNQAAGEINSITLRMENRKKYSEPKIREFFEQYPYTTNKRINSVIKKHDYLQLGGIDQFIADMPKDATMTMKMYDEKTQEMCGKRAVFYIIADKKDFKKTDSRRDPILLAQSPFGHFWQILGAWDEEMLFLEEL